MQLIYTIMTEKDKDMQANGQPEAEGFQDINSDENMAGSTHLNDAVPEENELDKVKSELDELRKKYLLLNADFDNFKKRNAKERIELINTANKEVIIALLEVLDDSERAARQLETATDINVVKDGVSLVFNKLHSVLQSKGLKPMESLNEEFNADLHDAITEIPAPAEEKIGKVLDVLQKGYYLNDKIIRHARVVVGK
ncbi:molecular chaperone GrpE [Chitinophaga niabensis]|uniref:Protein GrpE n=2 Tax=Chitinophaga niabensis TaxID=536979 RepID=A0A1N6H8Y1_9BACT|nr:molecular chaperone GrpE [Chitinophaga niabensis]